MAIKKRLSSAFRVVSLKDEALDGVPSEAMRLYEVSRDADDLGDLSKLATQPTIFWCVPLRPEYESIVTVPDADALWAVFARHVQKIENLPDVELKWISNRDGERRLDDECRKDIPLEVTTEIAAVIIEAASKLGVGPFSGSGGQWAALRVRRQALAAMRGKMNSATATESNM